MEISLDALLGVQRELADRLAQGVSGLLLHMHPPQLPPLPHKLIPFDIEFPPVPFVGGGGGVDLPAAAVASLVEIGDRLGQAGSGLGASVGGAVQQLSRQLSLPFIGESSRRRRWDAVPPPPPAVDVGVPAERPAAAGGGRALERPAAAGGGRTLGRPAAAGGGRALERPAAAGGGRALGRPAASGGGHALERPAAAGGGRALGRPAAAGGGRALERPVGDRDSLEAAAAAAAAATGSAAATSGSGAGGEDESDDEDNKLGFVIGTLGRLLRPKGRLNVSATYSTRDRTVDASVIARGETWRLQSSRNNSGPPFLIQLGPLILLRDSTFLFPINLSKQHLIWFGCDHKNRVFSICPAIWSKHRRWMLISMMRLNPVSCSFMDVDFPYGQLTYVAGEGLTARGYVPLFGVLPQFHGKFPGESKLSFSFKSTRGTRFTPAFQWPDNSVSFGVSQPVAWKKSGLMVKPSIQVSVCPTFGGSNPGIRAEVIHSLKEELNVTYGLSCSSHPSAFTSLSLGRSKMNGEVRGSGVVVTVEAPLDNVGIPSLSVQLNGGFEF